MTDKSVAELMADNDRLIDQFYTSCDEFIAKFDEVIERERIAHDELMRVLRRDEE